MVGLAVGVFLALVFNAKQEPYFALVLGMAVWLITGLTVGLRTGGSVCIYHLSGRLYLIRNNKTPVNYVRFLDYAADRILLRKVGGGYMFIHRMLLEWFAARYVEPGTMPKKDPFVGRTTTHVNRRSTAARI